MAIDDNQNNESHTEPGMVDEQRSYSRYGVILTIALGVLLIVFLLWGFQSVEGQGAQGNQYEQARRG